MARRRRPTRFPTLASALETYRVDDLRELGKRVIDRPPRRKAEVVGAIEGAVTGSNLPRLVERMDPLERATLSEAVHETGGELNLDHFRAKYGKVPDFGPSPDGWSDPILGPPDTDALLGGSSPPAQSSGGRKGKGLLRLFFFRPNLEARPRLPDDLVEPLRELLPEPEAAGIESAAELPEHYERPEEYLGEDREWKVRHEPEPLTVRETEVAARNEVAAVLALVDGGRIGVTERKSLPTAAAVRQVAGVLQGGDFYDDEDVGAIRAFAWPMLLQAGGLARRWGKKLRLTPQGREALGKRPELVLRALWGKWEWTDLLDELSRVEAIRGQSGKGRRGLTPVEERREQVALALCECPVGRWVAVEELWRYMRARGFDFEVSRNLWDLYLADKQYGALGYAGYASWEVLQGRYVLAFLFEYAATLGMVDVAYVSPTGARIDYHHIWRADEHGFLSRYDGLAWIRLTPLGAYCLDLTDRYEPAPREARPALTVMPNLEVALLDGAEVSPGDRLVLDRFAEPASDRVWRLDRERILAAVEEGHAVRRVGYVLPGVGVDGPEEE